MDPLIIVFGLGIGVLVGLTGMGGGSLMTPILIIVFGYNPVTAVGTELAHRAPTKKPRGLGPLPPRTPFFPPPVWVGGGAGSAGLGGGDVVAIVRHPGREGVGPRV